MKSSPTVGPSAEELARRLREAAATIAALLAGQVDAVVDARSQTPVLLSQAQEALRQSEERYRQIVETTTDGIVKIDMEGRIVFVNRRFAEMLGYEPREMTGTPVFAFMGPEAKALALAALQPDAPKTVELDTTFRHRSGNDIAVNLSATRLVDGDGVHTGALAAIRDVTERKKLQSQLIVSDRMASVGTLAAGVAHEINNPLAAVIANLDFVNDLVQRMGRPGSDPPDSRFRDEMIAPLEEAREAAQRVRLIVRDLKIFSRSPDEEARGAVEVRTIMESSLRMASNEIRHRARLVTSYGDVPLVDANVGRLGQVFLNLIVNAAQAMPEGWSERNELTVTTRFDGLRVIVEVTDTGPGIPPEIRERIFDAFFTTKGVGVGTGLGLAICQRIVTDMAGELTVESEMGKGSTFRVALPVAREEPPELAPPPSIQHVAFGGRRGRILLVDDEPLLVSSVRRSLSREHEVVSVLSAKEALSLCLGGERFDLILCDLMMPDMTGMALYRELAHVAPEQADKMIFLTGGAFTAEARRFLSETEREHLEKPFEPGNLRAIVHRHLR